MKKVMKKEPDMHQSVQTMNQAPPLPLPHAEKKRLMQAEVNLELFSAAEKEMKRRGLKIRSVMEYGLRVFILNSNPELAKKLGIISG